MIFAPMVAPDFGLFLEERGKDPRPHIFILSIENPRRSCRAENPTNPKIGPKIPARHPNSPSAGDRKNIPKIPEKYPPKYDFCIWGPKYDFCIWGVFRGVSEWVFRGISHFLCWASFFAFRGQKGGYLSIARRVAYESQPGGVYKLRSFY